MLATWDFYKAAGLISETDHCRSNHPPLEEFYKADGIISETRLL